MNIILLFFQDNELKDVLRMMLDMSPTKRPSVSEILLHPCFHQEETIALEVIERKAVTFTNTHKSLFYLKKNLGGGQDLRLI